MAAGSAELAERISPDLPDLVAEAAFAARREQTRSLADVLIRRTRLGLLDARNLCARQSADGPERAARAMADELGWDEQRVQAEVDDWHEVAQAEGLVPGAGGGQRGSCACVSRPELRPAAAADGDRQRRPGLVLGPRQPHARELAQRGRALAEAGASFIDVGGESGRTDRPPISEAEEVERVVPLVEALASDGLLVSVDTWRAPVVRAALQAGAAMINDVSALSDPGVAEACAETGAGLVVTHTRIPPKTKGFPEYDDVVADVAELLRERAAVARGSRG